MDQSELLVQVNQFSTGRRNFIASTAAALAAGSLASSPFNLFFNHSNRIKAIAFDAFPVFDPRPVFALVETIFPEQGKELSNVWRSKQFEYCWLRTAGKQYKNFWNVTEDALVFAAKKTGIDLSSQNKKELMGQYLELNIWGDVLPALEELKKKGVKLSFLSNMTNEMLTSCIRHSKVEKYFDHVVSTDSVRSYKPEPQSYQLGIDTLKLKREEILFAAFTGWDASGAKWFGYPTFWINRLNYPSEELNAIPDGIGSNMTDLVKFIDKQLQFI